MALRALPPRAAAGKPSGMDSRRETGSTARHPATPLPGLAGLREAVLSLTLLGRGRRPLGIDGSTVYYPLVGLLLGLLWLGTDRLAASLGMNRLASSAAVVAVAHLATGGQRLLDLGRTALALFAAGRPARMKALEGAPARRAYAAAAVVALLEILCLWRLDRFRPIGLLFAPLLAHCSIVVMAVGSRAARGDSRRVKFAPGVTFREFALASTGTFAAVFLLTEFLGLLLVLFTAVLVVGLRLFFHRWLDGVNRAVLGAACELTQLGVLALLALL
jgi:cobalamin synthase